jgi:3-hydroxyisobutyrate dehydrogenase-like beta-hydroxyacid dehydrogenase
MIAEVRIALVGFGEVGQILAADLRDRGVQELSVWDVQFAHEGSGPALAARKSGARMGVDPRDAAQGAALVISAVTAAQDVAAAQSIAPHLAPGAFFLDLNSVSPGVKRQTAAVIHECGGRYVEAAIMSPISPKRSAAPILLGGPHAQQFASLARSLGFSGAQVFSETLGQASAAKMCRSVVVKGMEALVTEALLAARSHGVENTVLDSLSNLFPAQDWHAQARYMISRALQHGARRAEEMREVAATVREAGFDPWMSLASAERQQWCARFGEHASTERLEDMLDALLAASAREGKERC